MNAEVLRGAEVKGWFHGRVVMSNSALELVNNYSKEVPEDLCGLAPVAAGLAAGPTSTPSKDCGSAPMASSLAAEIHKPSASFDCSTVYNGTEVKPINPVF